MEYEIQSDWHADDDGEYAETDLWEVRDIVTGEVIDCCLTDDQIAKYE